MKKIIFVMALAAMAVGCSKSEGGGEGGGSNQAAAVLSSPANNSECLTGTSISDTQSKVTLTWAAADDTEAYFVYIKNLSTQSTLQFSAGTATSYEATLSKGTPYSWYVSANKTSGTTAKSEIWKFYNAGTATTSHAPFPADLVSPEMSSTVNGPSVTLQWAGSDVDNDIDGYKVYMDTNASPTTLVGTVTAQKIEGVTVATGGTYYWKVITTDDAGNSTISPVYQFKVY